MATPAHTTDIQSLIPQRPPILMLDSFFFDDEDNCRSELTLRPDNMFVGDNGRIAAEGLLEHVAQTAAAHIGYCRKQAGQEVNLGFIGDIKRCNIGHSLPSAGQTVTTTVKIVSRVGNITMVAAECRADGDTVLSCRMKLAN